MDGKVIAVSASADVFHGPEAQDLAVRMGVLQANEARSRLVNVVAEADSPLDILSLRESGSPVDGSELYARDDACAAGLVLYDMAVFVEDNLSASRAMG